MSWRIERRDAAAGRDCDGFTLVEVLVAFAVLAILTIAIQRSVLSTVGGTDRADDRIGGTAVLRTLMLGPVGSGDDGIEPQSGRIGDYVWRTRFEPVGSEIAELTAAGAEPPRWRPMRMIVELDATPPRQLHLQGETIRLVKIADP